MTRNSKSQSRASAEVNGKDSVAFIGTLVRQARRGKYTVAELAARADVSMGLISQIERGMGNPSFQSLWKLAAALDLPMGAFFAGSSGQPRMLVQKADRRRLVLPHDGLVYELLTPDFNRQLSLIRVEVPPGFDNSARPFEHPGEECVHLLAGTVEAWVGDEVFTLKEGDTLTYDSALKHFWRNVSRYRAEIVVAATPPSF
jgi:transcriptional regulator with XRE-family HTH domain